MNCFIIDYIHSESSDCVESGCPPWITFTNITYAFVQLQYNVLTITFKDSESHGKQLSSNKKTPCHWGLGNVPGTH